MKVQQISLKERLTRLNSGCASDPAFNASAIETFMDIPIPVYLKDFPEEYKELHYLLIPQIRGLKRHSFRLAAERIYQIWARDKANPSMARAVEILMLPLRKCYEERNGAYGKSE